MDPVAVAQRRSKERPQPWLPQPAAVLQVSGEARAPSASGLQEKEGGGEGGGGVVDKADGAQAGIGAPRSPARPSSSWSAVAVGLSSGGKATRGDEEMEEKKDEGGLAPRGRQDSDKDDADDRRVDLEASQAGF